MNTPITNIAIAEFGSSARGDTDSYSDRDLLLVSDAPIALRAARAYYESQGYSCSTYTFRKLAFLANNGSLFVKHLSDEAQIISDPSAKLANILTLWSPRASYEKEIKDGRRLINLLRTVPDCKAGRSWAGDILFTAYRTMAVPFLAKRHIYVFSWSAISESLLEIGAISLKEAHTLESLRVAKHQYRSNSNDDLLEWCDLELILKSASRIFECKEKISRVNWRSVVMQGKEELLQDSIHGYYIIRVIERSMVALLNSPATSTHSAAREILAKTSCPAGYTFQATDPKSSLFKNSLTVINSGLSN